MTIDEKTRKARVVRWEASKRIWDSKLAKAANEHDTAVAKVMLEQAESALERLGGNVPLVPEETMYDKQKAEPIVKKIKKDRVSKSGVEKKKTETADPSKAKDSTDTTGTIGL